MISSEQANICWKQFSSLSYVQYIIGIRHNLIFDLEQKKITCCKKFASCRKVTNVVVTVTVSLTFLTISRIRTLNGTVWSSASWTTFFERNKFQLVLSFINLTFSNWTKSWNDIWYAVRLRTSLSVHFDAEYGKAIVTS